MSTKADENEDQVEGAPPGYAAQANPGLEGVNPPPENVDQSPHPELVVHKAQPDLRRAAQTLVIQGFLIAFIVIIVLLLIFELFQELINQSRVSGSSTCLRYIEDPPPYEPDDGSIARVAEDASFVYY